MENTKTAAIIFLVVAIVVGAFVHFNGQYKNESITLGPGYEVVVKCYQMGTSVKYVAKARNKNDGSEAITTCIPEIPAAVSGDSSKNNGG